MNNEGISEAAEKEEDDIDGDMTMNDEKRVEENEVLTPEEIEMKKKGIRELVFKSEYNLGGLLA